VRAGAVLLQLDDTLLRIELAQRQAAVAATRVRAARAAEEHARMKRLWEQPGGTIPAIARKRLDDATWDDDLAQAEVLRAVEAVRLAQARLDQTVVRAPFDGVVTQRWVDPGASVAAATRCVEVQDTATLWLEFSVPQRTGPDVGPGTQVSFAVDGTTAAPPPVSVQTCYPALDPASRTVRGRALVSNETGGLRPGQLARVQVQLPARTALVVPVAAVLRTGVRPQVRVQRSAGPTLVEVELGATLGQGIEVVAGLEAGDRVAIAAAAGDQR
jgi:membrane fusion protein, multidrug efflux system